MTARRCSLALVVLAFALAARAADAPLPAGAKARFGASRDATDLNVHFRGMHLLAPDYRTYLTGGGGASGPRLHDTRTGKVTEVPGFETADPAKERQDGRTVFAVSADGKRAVTERSADAYLVFEVATGKTVRVVKAPGGIGTMTRREVRPVSLSADGTVLAFDAGKGPTRAVVVWDLEKDAQRARVGPLPDENVSPVLSPDGQRLTTRDQLWDVSAGKAGGADRLIGTIPGLGASAAFSPDGKTLVAGSQTDGVVQLWDATTGRPVMQLLGRSQQGVAVALSPDGKTLAALAQTGAIDRWALPEGKPLKPTSLAPADLRLLFDNPRPEGLVFADNERVVAWGFVYTLNVTMVWEAPAVKPFAPAGGHLGAITAVRFTPDGKELVTAGTDRRVFRWDVATGRQTVVATRSPRTSSWYSHLAPDAAWGMERVGGAFYDLATGEELFALPGVLTTPSADFRRATASDGKVDAKPGSTWCQVWDVENRRRLARLTPPADNTRGCSATAFSPNNMHLVTLADLVEKKPGDQIPLLVTGWDATTGQKLGELRGTVPSFRRGWLDDWSTYLAVGDHSGAVVATADGKLWVADYERSARGPTLAELTRPQQRFTRPTFSPDGKTFAVGRPIGAGLEYGVAVYDWPGGKLLHTFAGHTGPVTALAFAPDGKTLASGSADGTVLVWDTALFTEPK